MCRLVLIGFAGLIAGIGLVWALSDHRLLEQHETLIANKPVGAEALDPKSPFAVQVERENGVEDQADDPDSEFLKRALVGTDAPSLIEFLKIRSPGDVDPDNLEPWIRQLGDPSFLKRKNAFQKLIDTGFVALDALRKAEKDSNAEISRAARKLIELQQGDRYWGLNLAVVRCLVKLRPPDTLEVLLRFLPFAKWDELIEEIWYGIDSVAFKDRELQPCLTLALEDKSPARRAVAGCIIGRNGNLTQKKFVGKLLADINAMVRLRAAQGLLAGKESSCISTLIDLLMDPSVEISWQAEELLHWVAGDEAPVEVIGEGTLEQRNKCHAAWENWKQMRMAKGETANFNHVSGTPRLIVMSEVVGEGKNGTSRAFLCGCDSKPRWRLEHLTAPADLRLLASQRLWLGQVQDTVRQSATIAERNLHGGTNWSKRIEDIPIRCSRLPNGATFIGGRNSVLEISPAGKELYASALPPTDLIQKERELPTISLPYFGEDCLRLANGRIRIVSRSAPRHWLITELTVPELEITNQVSIEGIDFGRVQLQSGRSLLLGVSQDGNLVEINDRGKSVASLFASGCLLGKLGPNDNVLVACGGRNNRLVEMNRSSNVLWQVLTENCINDFDLCFRLVGFGFAGFIPSPGFSLDSPRFWLQALRNRDKLWRRWGAYNLSEYWFKAKPFIRELIEALDDTDPIVRNSIGAALGKMGAPAVAKLIDSLRDTRPRLRAASAGALGHCGQKAESAVSGLITALKDQDSYVRLQAASSLGKISRAPNKAVPALAECLDDQSTDLNWVEPIQTVSEVAARALGEFGPLGEPAIASLVKALRTGHQRLRFQAALTLGAIGISDQTVVQSLIDCLNEKEPPPIQLAGVWALGTLGPGANQSVSKLIDILEEQERKGKKGDSNLGQNIVLALAKIDAKGGQVVPILLRIIRNSTLEYSFRASAVNALADMGKSAKMAVPDLLDIAREEESPISEEIRAAIEKLRQSHRGN